MAPQTSWATSGAPNAPRVGLRSCLWRQQQGAGGPRVGAIPSPARLRHDARRCAGHRGVHAAPQDLWDHPRRPPVCSGRWRDPEDAAPEKRGLGTTGSQHLRERVRSTTRCSSASSCRERTPCAQEAFARASPRSVFATEACHRWRRAGPVWRGGVCVPGYLPLSLGAPRARRRSEADRAPHARSARPVARVLRTKGCGRRGTGRTPCKGRCATRPGADAGHRRPAVSGHWLRACARYPRRWWDTQTASV